MQQSRRLDYGGDNGFWQDSVKNLTDLLVGPQAPIFLAYILIVLVLMLLFFGYLLKYRSRKEIINNFPDPRDIFLYLLIGNVLAFHIENALFGVLYPADRTSLQFVLFFTGTLFFLLDQAPYNFRYVRTIIIVPLAWFPVHFILSLNLNIATFEAYNPNIPTHFFEVVKGRQSSDGYPASIQGHQLRVMKWNWLEYTTKGEVSPIQYKDYPSVTADLQILDTLDHPKWRDFYRVIGNSGESPLVLVERTEKYQRIPVYHGQAKEHQETDDEYILLASIDVESLAKKPVFIGFRLTVVSDQRPLHAWVSAEVRNSDDKPKAYEYLQLDWYRPSWNVDDPEFINGLLFDKIPPDATRLLLYIWNEYKIPIQVKKSQIDLFVMREPEIFNRP
jgi:hypothetical protein